MKKITIALTLVLALTLALAACGGNDAPANSSTPTPPADIGTPDSQLMPETTPTPDSMPDATPDDNGGIETTPEGNTLPPADPNERGNSGSNIANGGIAALKDDYIYYVDDLYSSVFKSPVNSTEKIQIADANTLWGGINVVGDWIYGSSVNGGIYKLRTDGTEETKITDDNSGNILVVGDWVYYVHNGAIYKIYSDGTEKNKLADGRLIDVIDGWVFYSVFDGSATEVYKIRADGTENTLLVNSDDIGSKPISQFAVESDWIYYADNTTLNNVRTDGTGKTELLNSFNVGSFVVDNGWVYYSGGAISGGMASSSAVIEKMRTDGTERQIVFDVISFGNINIAGNWVFCNYDGWPHRIRTDGTDLEKLAE